MALCFRLRRAVTLSSTLINRQILSSAIPAASASPSLSSVTLNPEERDLTQSPHLHLPFQSRLFRSSTISLAPPRQPYSNNNNEEIGPDTILFEGCDYNHWLITMEFPKDPKPTPEEMVETYVQTLAKVVGSVEEAKKRMYACSTTTYTGFQAVMSEETSEKFKGLPGVVFVLPDSYIDPANKEYGGDKYINGTIIPRPPPIQYGQRRYADRNRDRQNHSRGPPPYQQGNSAYNQGPTHGDTRNYREQQNSVPQQNFGPPGTGERRDPMPMNNAPGGRDTYQGDRRDPMPSYQASYSQGERGNYYPQGRRDFPPGDNRNYAHPQGGNYGQGAVGTYGQGTGGAYGQGTGGLYRQGAAGGPYGQGAAGGPYGQGAAGGPYGQGAAGGQYGQGAAGGQYGQGAAGGQYGQGAVGGPYEQSAPGPNGQGVAEAHGQEMGSGFGRGHGGDQRFTQVEERSNMQREQRNYAAVSNTGTDQGRY
ncbi:hypothetical protein F0562_029041 [Nyssa sinensis]|uniref:MORF/ORRM1/DAG-like MORF domain-containing protein n=1 Tax=Nyssa sinensis TaxID=561372 RepID=A0A5J5AZU3_9ASTE|nr:hypothetical protein F0562_029041 [Nyssa sinensis]